jgi:hypothetical protein
MILIDEAAHMYLIGQDRGMARWAEGAGARRGLCERCRSLY